MKPRILLLTIMIVFSFASFLKANSDYLVGPGDVLRVTVYDHPDLNGTIRVNNDGTVDFPLIGTLKVGGNSVSQVANRLANALADGYIVNPQVSIFIEEFRSRKVVIMGQVKNPGIYELRGPASLLELISQAGGLIPDAGETINITRKSDGNSGEKLIKVDMKKLMTGNEPSNDIAVLDGDNVFVTQAGNVYVSGEVRRPNAYRFEKGTSVIQAITMAGGFTELAAKGKVKIIRKNAKSEDLIENVPLHTPVLPEDVIVVPESFF